VLGIGIAYAPLAASAIDQLPAWLNRSGALLILVVLTVYVPGSGSARGSSAAKAGASPCRMGR